MPFNESEMYLVKALLSGLRLSEAVGLCVEVELDLSHLQETLHKLQGIPGLYLVEV